jgi:hypothetical protein
MKKSSFTFYDASSGKSIIILVLKLKIGFFIIFIKSVFQLFLDLKSNSLIYVLWY